MAIYRCIKGRFFAFMDSEASNEPALSCRTDKVIVDRTLELSVLSRFQTKGEAVAGSTASVGRMHR